ncbi:ABC transporter permease subunit [Kibdelosporangium persicum]|uniref:ABC-type transport system involved in multi-copper enzyme maturation, permease component n=1 Tax=Kibdelosporangium persicum TaxID=2698649 RepID=A0ABX2FEF4_9PSEU|nr:ABC transporter permease subunit [Kibdelosporangium persicum]NRN69120.1 ABC-type transport system involved in multi-copper enzyme maturation, permease component [Kibdelosporangium persicum]
MIWLTWRQFRLPAAAVAAIVVTLAIVLVIIQLPSAADAQSLFDQITDLDYSLYYAGLIVLYAIPPIIGIFWGAPLITRELETGTYRLVWNQTVTRGRWLAVKLGTAGLVAVTVGGLAGLVVSWWAGPIDTATLTTPNSSFGARMEPVVFAARGIVPIGYSAFAFVLGVTVGILVRRTVAAMAVTLVAYIAVQLIVPVAVRPYIVPPDQQTVAITEENITMIGINESGRVERLGVENQPGSWLLSNETVDPAGNPIKLGEAVALAECSVTLPNQAGPPPGPPTACFAKLTSLGYRQELTYQPASRFWGLQALELAVYLALTALLTWLSFRLIRRRLS